MKFKLKNSVTVEIKPLGHSISASQFKKYFNGIIGEQPESFLYKNTPVTSGQQNKWLADQRENIRKKEEVMLVATSGNEIIGLSEADRGHYRHRDKVLLSVSIARAYRGQGLGKKLMIEIIKLTKQKLFSHRIIYLTVSAGNKPAYSLYKKLGFSEFARFKKWQKHRGKYEDMVFMKLSSR